MAMDSNTVMTVIFLAGCACMDLRRRQVWWPGCLLFGAMAALIHLLRNDTTLFGFTAGLLPGLALLLLGWVSRGAVGYGDGLAVTACGAALGFSRTFSMLLTALCLAAAWAGILLVSGKGHRKDQFPFIPFLWAAECCMLIW